MGGSADETAWILDKLSKCVCVCVSMCVCLCVSVCVCFLKEKGSTVWVRRLMRQPGYLTS